ncbi:hypothetical protein LSAT2_009033 [Lamellibrachia satsuma]|nr:hypothetical protein LSAT2_009033 [Lamellibrachia satsuma]
MERYMEVGDHYMEAGGVLVIVTWRQNGEGSFTTQSTSMNGKLVVGCLLANAHMVRWRVIVTWRDWHKTLVEVIPNIRFLRNVHHYVKFRIVVAQDGWLPKMDGRPRVGYRRMYSKWPGNWYTVPVKKAKT